jgi:hypothetical protein
MTQPDREPSADMRQFASAMHQMFIALTWEGFSEQQALIVIGQVLAASAGGGQQ